MSEIIWTNGSGKARREAVERHFAGREIPEQVWALRSQDERAEAMFASSCPDAAWAESEKAILDHIHRVEFPAEANTQRILGQWDATQFTIRKREPELEHRNGFPRMIEEAAYVVGYPPEARKRAPFAEGTVGAKEVEVGTRRDLIDPVTGLVPVCIVVGRNPQEHQSERRQ